MSEVRRTSDEARRNARPLGQRLERVLPERGTILEIGSGTGEHAVFFASLRRGWTWQPSDPEPQHRESIAAWIAHHRVKNVAPPLTLDLLQWPWPAVQADAIVAIHVLHDAPEPAANALVQGAARLLAPGAPLVIHGPFRAGGRCESERMEEFDRRLRARGRALPELETLEALATSAGFTVDELLPFEDQTTVVLRK